MTLRIRPEALDDIRAAMAWYDGREPELGAAFLAEADALFQRIDASPQHYPQVHGPLCRALMRRFPYTVYFAFEGDGVVIFAVLHQRRDRGVLDTRR